MSSNIEHKSVMERSLLEISCLAPMRKEEAKKELWEEVSAKTSIVAENIIYAEDRQLDSFAPQLEESVKGWLNEGSGDIHNSKTLFEIDFHTKSNSIIRLVPISRNDQTWRLNDSVESRRIVSRQQYVEENSKGLNFEDFTLNELDINDLKTPIKEALSFALTIDGSIYGPGNTEPLRQRRWLVLG